MTSRSCICSLWFEAGWSSVFWTACGLRLLSCCWGPNRWASLPFLLLRAIRALFFSQSKRNTVQRPNFCLNHRVFCSLIYIKPALNSREECNKFVDLLFRVYLLCLLNDSAPVTPAHYRVVFYSNLLYFSYILRPIFTFFTHFTLHQFCQTFNSTLNLLTPCLLGICNHQEDTFCLTKKSCAFHAWCKFWQNYKLTSPDPKCKSYR